MALAVTGSCLTGCAGPRFENVATSGTGQDGATSLSIPVPPSASDDAAGDLLVAILGVKGNPNTQGPSEWAAVPGFSGFNGATCVADTQGIACQLAAFYKIADGSESSATFSLGSTQQAVGAVVRYANVNTRSPIGAAREQRGASSTPTAPVITTTRDNSRVLRIALGDADGVAAFLSGSLVLGNEPPSLRFNVVSFQDSVTDPVNGCGPPLSACSGTAGAVGLAASDARRSAAGPSGTAKWSLPGGDQWITASIEIRAGG